MPSLMSGSPIDKRVKGQLLSDMLQLVGIPAVSIKECEYEIQKINESKKFKKSSGKENHLVKFNGNDSESEDNNEDEYITHKFMDTLLPIERNIIEDYEDEIMRMKSGIFFLYIVNSSIKYFF